MSHYYGNTKYRIKLGTMQLCNPDVFLFFILSAGVKDCKDYKGIHALPTSNVKVYSKPQFPSAFIKLFF